MIDLQKILVIFVTLILVACTSRNVRVVDGVLVVDVADVGEGRDIPVETLAETVEVIPLETADNAFFEFNAARFSDNYLVFKAMNGMVRVFGRDGRFIGLLEGVDEETHVYDVVIDEQCGEIYASVVGCDSVLVFDLAGHNKRGIKLKSCTSKAVLAADSCGVALAQFDFTDQPDGFNAAVIGTDSVRYASRPSLSTHLHGKAGVINGFSNETFASCTGGQLRFMTSFCDTLFRYDTRSNRIVPELAVNIPAPHGVNMHDAIQDTAQACSWLQIIALPRHYIIRIFGAGAQDIVVDREQMTATRASIVSGDLPNLHFTGSYAYAVLPPDGRQNSTLIRWKLSATSRHKPAPKPNIPQPANTQVAWDKAAADSALDLSCQGLPQEALRIIDAAIDRVRVKRGHPSLAYAYAVKRVLYTQLEQFDSADYYRQLINAPLTSAEQRRVSHRLMDIHSAQGNHQEAQLHAMAFGAIMIGEAQDSKSSFELNENRDRINDLSQQAEEDSRLLCCLLAALAIVVIAAAAIILTLRRQKKRQIAATRRELQSRMEQRIEALSAARELSMKTTDEMRAEMMKNHAIIRRISNPSVTRPLSEGEEDLLHRITEMLYPGFTARLQSKAASTLNKRELTICHLIRFGVPQLSIGVLLDVKPASFRVIKSHLKRDRLHLPVEAELEDFICNL